MKLPKKGVLVIGTDRDSGRNYIGKAVDLIDSLGVKPGDVVDVTVVHDDDCSMLAGRGYCDCEPIVVPGTPEEFHQGRAVQ